MVLMYSDLDLFLFFLIFRFTYFLIMHGAKALCKVMDGYYRRFPLIQGGVGIPVTVEMDITKENVYTYNGKV